MYLEQPFAILRCFIFWCWKNDYKPIYVFMYFETPSPGTRSCGRSWTRSPARAATGGTSRGPRSGFSSLGPGLVGSGGGHRGCISQFARGCHIDIQSSGPIWLCPALIWDNMCRKNSDKIHVLFSPSLWLQSALLCHPGSLERLCSWTTPQCESSQVTSLAK